MSRMSDYLIDHVTPKRRGTRRTTTTKRSKP